jgi:thiol-disulfide isomerase/thioredoxin
MKKLLTVILLTIGLLSSLNASYDMTMTDIKGVKYNVTGTEQGFKIKGFENKVIIFELFGNHCPPCLRSIPHLNKLQAKFKDKLRIVTIEVQGMTNKALVEFAKVKGIEYITIAEENAGDVVKYISQRAQWKGSIPFTLATDIDGNVQFVQVGLLSETELEDLVTQLSTKKKEVTKKEEIKKTSKVSQKDTNSTKK